MDREGETGRRRGIKVSRGLIRNLVQYDEKFANKESRDGQ